MNRLSRHPNRPSLESEGAEIGGPDEGRKGPEKLKTPEEVAAYWIREPQALLEYIDRAAWIKLPKEEGQEEAKSVLVEYPEIDFYSLSRAIFNYPWSELVDQEMSREQALAVLDLIRRSKDVEDSNLQRSIKEVAKGWLERRFENNWMGIIDSHFRFLKSCTHKDQLDEVALETFIEAVLGEPPGIITPPTKREPLGSPGYTAAVAGVFLVSPEMQEKQHKALEVFASVNTAAAIIEKDEQWEKAYESFMLALEEEVVKPERQHPKRKVKKKEQASDKILRELRQQKEENFQRFRQIVNFLAEIYGSDIVGGTFAKLPEFDQYDQVQDLPYPYNLYLDSSEMRIYLRNYDQELFGPERAKEYLEEFVQSLPKPEDWDYTSFALLDEGMKGFVITKENLSQELPLVRAERIRELFDKYNIVSRIRGYLSGHYGVVEKSPLVAFSIMAFPEVDPEIIVLPYESYYGAGHLEQFVEAHAPELIETRLLEIMRDNFEQRQQIPQEVTRVPTKAGDRYRITEEGPAGELFEQVILRRHERGGLEFELSLRPDGMFLEEAKAVTGKIKFTGARVKIEFSAEDARNLGTNGRVLFQRVILQAVKESCTPPLPEVTEEVKALEGAEQLSQIPGYFSHVGGYRSSGERKSWTREAQRKLDQVTGGGISLKEINKYHREVDPEDDRYITFVSPYEIEDAPPLDRGFKEVIF